MLNKHKLFIERSTNHEAFFLNEIIYVISKQNKILYCPNLTLPSSVHNKQKLSCYI